MNKNKVKGWSKETSQSDRDLEPLILSLSS